MPFPFLLIPSVPLSTPAMQATVSGSDGGNGANRSEQEEKRGEGWGVRREVIKFSS